MVGMALLAAVVVSDAVQRDGNGPCESYLYPLQNAAHAAVAAPTWFCGSTTWKGGPRPEADSYWEAPVNN